MKFIATLCGLPERKRKAGDLNEPAEMDFPHSSNKKSLSENDSADDESSSSSIREKSQQARNISEKRRRDKLNLYINELSSMLPSGSSRKLDKSSVLKLTVTYLKMHNDLSLSVMGDGKTLKSSILSSEELGQLMLEALGGFLLVINKNGTVIYVADSVKPLIGIDAASVTGEPLRKFVHCDDIDAILNELAKPVGIYEEKAMEDLDMNLLGDLVLDSKKERGVVTLNFRMSYKKNGNENEYRDLVCRGKWRSWVDKDADSQAVLDGEKVLVMLACLKSHSDLREVASSEGPKTFSSRHSMDGKFLFVDTNSPQVTGYLPYELLGTSFYHYVYSDDIEEVARAHRSLISSLDSVMLFFRFQSKGGEWLLLRTTCRVTYNPMTSKPQYFTSSFTLASAEEIAHFRKLKLKEEGNVTPLPMSSDMNEAEKDINESDLKSSASRPNEMSPSTSVGRDREGNTTESEKDAEGDKEESQERFLDAQRHLHDQLTTKQNRLATNFTRQKKQLSGISDLISQLEQLASKDTTMRGRLIQHQQMFDYVNNTFQEQKRLHGELHHKLQEKIKELETQQRAIDLRRKAMRYKKMLEAAHKRDQGPSPRSEHTSAGKRLPFKDVKSPPPSSSLASSTTTSTSSYSSPDRNDGPLGNQPPWKSPRQLEFISVSNRDVQNSQQIQGAESLQNQLQKLQHRQDILSNQGLMNSLQEGLQGNPSSEVLQLLMQQQVCNQQQQISSQQTNPMRKERDTDLVQFLQAQQQQQQNMLSGSNSHPIGCQGSQISTDLFHTLRNSTTELGNPRSDAAPADQQTQALSQQILLQLQVLQQQLLSQIEMIQRPRESNQPINLMQLIPALQQLQEAQQVLLEQQQQQQHHQQQQQQQQQQHRQHQQQQQHHQQQQQLQQRQQQSIRKVPATPGPFSPRIPRSPQSVAPMDAGSYLRLKSHGRPDNYSESLRRTSLAPSSGANTICDTSPSLLSNAQSHQYSPRLRTPQTNFVTGSQSNEYVPCATSTQGQPIVAASGASTRVQQGNRPMDCFANIPSPELESYLAPAAPCHEMPVQNSGATPAPDGKVEKLEEEDMSYQPLLANQQQLIQWQRAQRLQIIKQQQEQLDLIQQDQTNECTGMPRDPSQQQLPQQQDPKQQSIAPLRQMMQPPMYGSGPVAGQAMGSSSSSLGSNISGLEPNNGDRMSNFDLLELMCQQPLTDLDEDGEQVLDLLIAENSHLWNNPDNTF